VMHVLWGLLSTRMRKADQAASNAQNIPDALPSPLELHSWNIAGS